ncbi:MAG: N-6 DNA methylase, partial [Chloroflexota bacterium]|nr:N-6 DNA methylase [Chloroflexota bacterium]
FREAGETHGRVDYVFRIDGRDVFYVEAKAPHVPLDRVDAVMQAKAYAWHSRDVFIAAVTDFEEFRLYDATAKPDRKHPNAGLIFAYRYDEYLKPKTLDDLWLVSREAVAEGSIDRLLKKSSVQARQRIPVDQAFLDDLSEWREELAKAVFKANPELSPADLNSVVQVFLDRLIFIRICEDRRIMAPRQLAEVAENWEYSGKRVSITNDLNALFHEVNGRLNGDIFKPHASEKIDWDSNAALVADIIKKLYFPASPYLFDKIPVELLGSIYERYLGKTIRVTATRAIVEDKPEVRKAGGVYYTPKYIVDYIVAQTVGKLIEDKTPKQIEKLKILDSACGSGSFLLGAYQALLDYHTQYYAQRARQRGGGGGESGQARLFRESSGEYGEFKLSLEQKSEILRHNIFGVDIDPQAVEITMMSLYIKMLEGERGIIAGRAVLPRLRDNIKCGNSLIGYDIGALSDDDKARINPFDWNSKSEGFGEIMAAGGFDAVIGNPPWGADLTMQEKQYLMQRFSHVHMRTPDTFNYFLANSHALGSTDGMTGMIVPNNFLFQHEYARARQFFVEKAHLETAVNLGDGVFDV